MILNQKPIDLKFQYLLFWNRVRQSHPLSQLWCTLIFLLISFVFGHERDSPLVIFMNHSFFYNGNGLETEMFSRCSKMFTNQLKPSQKRWIVFMPSMRPQASKASAHILTSDLGFLLSASWNSFCRERQNESSHSVFGFIDIVGKKSWRAL